MISITDHAGRTTNIEPRGKLRAIVAGTRYFLVGDQVWGKLNGRRLTDTNALYHPQNDWQMSDTAGAKTFVALPGETCAAALARLYTIAATSSNALFPLTGRD